MGCELSCDINRRHDASIRAIEIENAVNKAVTKIEYDTLGAFENEEKPWDVVYACS